MKIGIYLGYAPYAKTFSLKQEGLGRYLAFLIKGLTQLDNEIVIACPNWVVNALDELFDEANIDKEKIKFILPSSLPILYRWYLKHVNKELKVKRNRLRGLSRVSYKFIGRIIDSILYTKNNIYFGFIFILGILVSLVFLPFAVVGGLFYALYKILYFFAKKLGLAKKNRASLKVWLKEKYRNTPILRKVYSKLRESYNSENIKEKIRLNSVDEIIRKINHMEEPTEIWYCPMAFWSEFHKIRGTKVVCAPDLVTAEFAQYFSKGEYVQSSNNVKHTLENGKYYITYCDYVKESLLKDKFGKDSADVIVINHAFNDMKQYVDVGDYFKKIPNMSNVNEYFARHIVMKSIPANSVNMAYYLSGTTDIGYDFSDVKYIFFSSQIRGNKNILNLIKAYEYILRVKNVQIKLFLTCDYNVDPEIRDYIYTNRLQYDILSFYSLTNQQLAALYMCADLVVNPTLYEGGFPFTFGEGLSVGTPSVMSRIPQTLEVLKDYDSDDYLFDPYNYMDIAKKIIYGLEHRTYLYDKQKVVYDALKTRDWCQVCDEYVSAFSHFIKRDALVDKGEVD